MDDVAVGDDVVTPLAPKRAALACAGVAAGVDELVPRDDLRADEAALHVGVDLAGRLRRRLAARDRVCARLDVAVSGEEGDQPQELERRADHAVEAALGHAKVGAHRVRLPRIELGELGLEAGTDRQRPGSLRTSVLDDPRRRFELGALLDVRNVEDRLRGQRGEQPSRVGRGARRWHRASRAPRLERLDQLVQPFVLGDGALLARLRLARDAFTAALGLLEVGEHQLSVDHAGVGDGVGRRVGQVMGAHEVEQDVRLADRAEELVAEALAAVRALDEPGDVVKRDRLVDDRVGADRLRDLVEALVGDRDDGDVRVDRRERVAGRLSTPLRECVEESGLAGVRQSDDRDLHRSPATAQPRAAPARMSDG